MSQDLINYAKAIAAIESGGDPSAIGPVTKSGDRAYGMHQVMGRNIPEWTKMATGTSLTPDQFLKDPTAQTDVFNHYFGSALQKYGNPQDAASEWFTGQPQDKGAGRSDGYNTGSQYVQKFTDALNKVQAQAPTDPNGVLSQASEADTDGDTLPANAKPTMYQGQQTPDMGDRLGALGNGLQQAGAGLIAINNPAGGAMLQSVANAKLAANKASFGVIGQDSLGQNRYGFINPTTGKIVAVGADGKPVDAGSDGASSGNHLAKIQAAGANGATTEEKLQLVPPEIQPYVKSIIEGRTIPTNIGKALRDRINATAFAVDDKLDQNSLLQRQAFEKGMGSGNPSAYGGQVASANKVTIHLDDAYKNLEVLSQGALGDSDYGFQWMNKAKEGMRGAAGDKAFRDARGRYNTAIEGIAEEASKMLSGRGGAEGTKKYWLDRLTQTNGPTEAAAALDTVRTMMMGQMNGVANAKSMAYGRDFAPEDFLGKKEQAAMQRVKEGRFTYQHGQSTAAPQSDVPALSDIFK